MRIMFERCVERAPRVSRLLVAGIICPNFIFSVPHKNRWAWDLSVTEIMLTEGFSEYKICGDRDDWWTPENSLDTRGGVEEVEGEWAVKWMDQMRKVLHKKK